MNRISLEKILELNLSLSSQTRPSKSFYIAAMKQACCQAIDLCAEKQAEVYKEMGYTNTGKKIAKTILKIKDEIE